MYEWVALSAVLCERSPVHCCTLDPRAGDAGRRPLHREDPCEGGVPGADDDPVDRGVACEGGVPGADDDPVDRGVACEGGVPGADDDPVDPVLPFAANVYEPPAPISATVARAASGRSFLLMFHSCVW
jgi:hypothetical protein